jgi:hypothetical protein
VILLIPELLRQKQRLKRLAKVFDIAEHGDK